MVEPAKYDTQIDALGLPQNLDSIGINFHFTNEPRDDVADHGNDPFKVYKQIPVANTHANTPFHLICKRIDPARMNENPIFEAINSNSDIVPPLFKVGDNVYRILKAFKPTSAEGRIFKIESGNGNKYILKVCQASSKNLKTNVLSEALIQHFIYKTTMLRNHYDCPYAMKIINVFKIRFKDQYKNPLTDAFSKCIGIIMEEGDPWMSIEDHMRIAGDSEKSKTITKVCRILQNLQRMYGFVHGDLHCENAFYKEHVVKLIDFGRSTLKIGEVTLYGHMMFQFDEDFWTPENVQQYDISYLVCSLRAFDVIKDDSDIIKRTIGKLYFDYILELQTKMPGDYLHAYVSLYFQGRYRTGLGIVVSKVKKTANPKEYLNVQNTSMFNSYVVNRNIWCMPPELLEGGFRRSRRKSNSRRKMKRTIKNKNKNKKQNT
jgi:hypothetical protein